MDLEQKYELLYAHEEAFSYRLAQEVVKKPEASVWMILLPVLFVHHFYRVNQYKEGVRSFAEHFLSSKKKALDKAYDQALAGKSMDYGMEVYFSAQDLSGQNMDLVEKQVQVIKVMEAHYLALMQASGQSLEQLVHNAYQEPEQYRRFLNSLEEAEQELNIFLLQNVHTSEESSLVVRQVEQQCAQLREEEIKLFF
ncbi:MAG: NF038143 family protein [Desulfovermiculus sp.]